MKRTLHCKALSVVRKPPSGSLGTGAPGRWWARSEPIGASDGRCKGFDGQRHRRTGELQGSGGATPLASSPLSLASRVRRPLDVPPARFRRTRMKVGFITLGCDKNTVDTERYLAELADHGGEYTATCRSRRHHRQHLRLHRCREEGIDRRDGRSGRDTRPTALPGRRCRWLHGRAPQGRSSSTRCRRSTSSSAPRRWTGSLPELAERGLIGADRSCCIPGVRIYTGDLPHVRYLKISEGLRSRLRVLRDPAHARQASLVRARRGRSRSAAARAAGRARDQSRRAGSGALRARPARRRHASRAAGIARCARRRFRGSGCSICTPPGSRRACSRSWRASRASFRISTCRCSTRPTRCSRACGVPSGSAPSARGFARFRDAVPGVAIRTTCIVGFPGETEEDFDELLEFLEEMQFDRVGAFTYSPQEGTRAAEMVDDVPDAVKRERLERLTELQRPITAERYERIRRPYGAGDRGSNRRTGKCRRAGRGRPTTSTA